MSHLPVFTSSLACGFSFISLVFEIVMSKTSLFRWMEFSLCFICHLKITFQINSSMLMGRFLQWKAGPVKAVYSTNCVSSTEHQNIDSGKTSCFFSQLFLNSLSTRNNIPFTSIILEADMAELNVSKPHNIKPSPRLHNMRGKRENMWFCKLCEPNLQLLWE